LGEEEGLERMEGVEGVAHQPMDLEMLNMEQVSDNITNSDLAHVIRGGVATFGEMT